MSELGAAIEDAVRANQRLRHVQSVVVAVADATVAECYFRGRRANDLSNVHSITKSVLSTLVGIAVSDGWLELDASVIEVLPEQDRSDPRKAQITVRHLLTMTSGLDAEGDHDIDEIADRGESWVAGPLAAPLVAEPGTTFAYNNGAAHVLSVLVARKTGRPLLDLAEERLFRPLGISEYRWRTDPEGNPLGYGHVELRPRELVSLGRLYLERGRVDGRQLLDPAFVDLATTAATPGGPPEGTAYGFLWWITETAGYPSFFGGGFAGQYLVVVPALELVAVTTADAAVWIPTAASPRRLVEEVVVPFVEG
jgi:CubicO group peptidase (beta-lactamase class C family)